ncbi:MAG: hypothetical protein P8I56_14230, partial [Paracoccaceae bacterium]|nr:hypothetical protein [Paracoccaceae bacterium]
SQAFLELPSPNGWAPMRFAQTFFRDLTARFTVKSKASSAPELDITSETAMRSQNASTPK